jgi:hypothetical protein
VGGTVVVTPVDGVVVVVGGAICPRPACGRTLSRRMTSEATTTGTMIGRYGYATEPPNR